jgi:hypothetical protein
MHLLVDVKQFGRDAVALVDAGGAEAVIEPRRFRKRPHAVGVREACRVAEPEQLGDRLEFATPVGSPLPFFWITSVSIGETVSREIPARRSASVLAHDTSGSVPRQKPQIERM